MLAQNPSLKKYRTKPQAKHRVMKMFNTLNNRFNLEGLEEFEFKDSNTDDNIADLNEKNEVLPFAQEKINNEE